ncbi:MAG: hypothetical protein HPAVJP_0950 [Candidatus Hepatoplasma vulgare]|nr:MAG: hypothetical protein HPAVJP_0950 [Candidatus Hepatoplasma sp.]
MQKDDLYAKQKDFIKRFQNTGDIKIVFQLMEDYKGMIIKISKTMQQRFRSSPLTYEDYFQFLIYRFIERTKKYNLDSQMKYPNYIQTFLIMDITNYARKFLTHSHRMMNYSSLQNYEDSTYFFEENLKITFDDINYNSLTNKQKDLFLEILKNEGSVKKTSKKLKIPEKTIYRHRKEIIRKLNKDNGVD